MNCGIEASIDHRLPKWLRVLILAATTLVFAAVFGILLIAGIAALSHTAGIKTLATDGKNTVSTL